MEKSSSSEKVSSRRQRLDDSTLKDLYTYWHKVSSSGFKNIRFRCNSCPQEYADSPSRLYDHSCFKCPGKRMRFTQDGNTMPEPHRMTKEMWDERCYRLIFRAGLPLDHFEPSNIDIFIAEVHAATEAGLRNYIPPSRKMVTARIEHYHEKAEHEIKALISTSEFVNFSCDETTCRAGRRIFNLSCYIPGIGSYYLENIDLRRRQ